MVALESCYNTNNQTSATDYTDWHGKAQSVKFRDIRGEKDPLP